MLRWHHFFPTKIAPQTLEGTGGKKESYNSNNSTTYETNYIIREIITKQLTFEHLF